MYNHIVVLFICNYKFDADKLERASVVDSVSIINMKMFYLVYHISTAIKRVIQI